MVYGVSQVLDMIQDAFREHPVLGTRVTVRGEVSGFKIIRGHAYFSLKDETGLLRCVFFSIRNALRFQDILGSEETLSDGVLLDATGQVSLYPKNGDVQLYVKKMEVVSKEGFLQARFEKLKRMLVEQGVIPRPEAHRRALPLLPSKIAVVASRSSAAFQDILRTLQIRNPSIQVLLFHTGVQGERATPEIVRALDMAGESDAQLVLLARGGGSLEDLWNFNEESVVRAVRRCALPVVVGVGHEVDHTLSEYAGDVAASTPTAAAMAAVPSLKEIMAARGQKMLHVSRVLKNRLEVLAQRGVSTERGLQYHRPEALLDRRREELERKMDRVEALLSRKMQMKHAALSRLFERMLALQLPAKLELRMQLLQSRWRHLQDLNPAQVLKRGFCWVESEGRIIPSVQGIPPHGEISLVMRDGRVYAQVEKVEQKSQ